MKNAALVAHVRQLCCLGLGGRAIMPALINAIRELVLFDCAEFAWVDARGEMTNLYAEPLLPPDVIQFYFHRAETPDHPALTFRVRAALADPVTSLSVTDAMRQTDYYRHVLSHLAAEHMLFCVVRERGIAVGQLSLYRSAQRPAFNAADRSAIGAVAGYIAHGLDDSSATARYAGADPSYRDTEQQAMLTLERDGRLRHCSSAARRMLLFVTLDSVNRGTVSQQDAAIHSLTRELAEQLVGSARDGDPDEAGAKPPGMVVTNRWGRFVLRAYWLTDDPHAPDALIGVQLRRQEPTILRLSQAMRRLALSPQQKEVGLLLAQGKSNPEIAGALGVSLNTANYHVKQLFAKLNAHERSEVAPKLLGISDGGLRHRPAQRMGSGG